MTAAYSLLIAGAVIVGAYALFVGCLVASGRRGDMATVARYISDGVLLFKRLLRDPRVPRRTKALIGLTVGYLLSPIDLVPDFIPVAGFLDDVIVALWVLRRALRATGEDLIRELWPGSASSCDAVVRLALSRPE